MWTNVWVFPTTDGETELHSSFLRQFHVESTAARHHWLCNTHTHTHILLNTCRKSNKYFFFIPLNTCNYKTFSSCSYLLCNALLRGANSDLTSSPFACTRRKNNSSSETRLHPGVNTESRAEQSTQDFLNKPFWDQLVTSPLLYAHRLRTTFHFSPAEPSRETPDNLTRRCRRFDSGKVWILKSVLIIHPGMRPRQRLGLMTGQEIISLCLRAKC